MKSYATTGWVTGQFIEVTRTVDKLGLAVEEISRKITDVLRDQERLYKTHDELLKQRAEHERQQAENEKIALKKAIEEKTASAIAKRWLPIASLLIGLITLVQIIGALVAKWISQIPIK